MLSGLILAGGESRRMKRPKALLQAGESTFIESILSKMQNAGVDPVVAVAGVHYPEIDRRLAGKCRVVLNAGHRQGQFSSLQCGLRDLLARAPGVSGVVVWPVDQPLVSEDTVSALISAFVTAGCPITVPVFQWRHGHPVIYGREAVDTILSMDLTHTGKDLRKIYEDRTCNVEVKDEGVLIDIDTVEDYKKYLKR